MSGRTGKPKNDPERLRLEVGVDARFVVYAIAATEAFNADRWVRNRCRSALRLPAADRAD